MDVPVHRIRGCMIQHVKGFWVLTLDFASFERRRVMLHPAINPFVGLFSKRQDVGMGSRVTVFLHFVPRSI